MGRPEKEIDMIHLSKMKSIPVRLKRELRRECLAVRSTKHREEVSTCNYSEQTGARKGQDHQLSAPWECSKSLAHSVKMSTTLWNNGPGTILNPRYSSKGCTQEYSPEQNKACAVKEFTQKKNIRCVR